jgi:hypothetical protein
MVSEQEEPETPVFVVVDIGMTLDADGGYWPTAVIEVGPGDKAIADLARVHSVEGIGDIRTEAAALPLPDEQRTDEATHLFLLAVMITSPVRCTFGISFVLPAQGHVLSEAAEHGHLVIATTPPDEANEAAAAAIDDSSVAPPLWLAIDVDADLLARAVADLP